MSQAEPQPNEPRPEEKAGMPPVHPLSALLLLVVDNMWNMGDWAPFAWIVTIPLAFLSVFFPGLFLQRYANHDGWGKSTGKAMMLAALAAVPTSIAGTPVGVAFLAWAGLDKWRSGKLKDLANVDAVSGATSVQRSVPQKDATVIDVPVEVESTPKQLDAPGPDEPVPAATGGGGNPVPPVAEPQYVLPPPQRASKVSVVILCLLMVALFFTAGIMLLKYASEAVQAVAEKVGNFSLIKKREPLSTVFTASLPEFSRTAGGELKIAAFKITEVHESTDFVDLGGLIPLGETKASIRVPVNYSYHIVLREKWNLEVTNGICYVTAPLIRPDVPAIDTTGLEKNVKAGFFTKLKPGEDPQARLDHLEKSLTARMWINASSPKYQELAREKCRVTVSEFVRDWILQDDRYKEYDVETLKVIFPDEVGTAEARSLPSLIIRKEE